MDDEARKAYLTETIGGQTRGYWYDLDGAGMIHYAKATALIDAGAYMEILTKADARALQTDLDKRGHGEPPLTKA